MRVVLDLTWPSRHKLMTVEFSKMLADCVYRVFILRSDDKRGGQWTVDSGLVSLDHTIITTFLISDISSAHIFWC